jgi:hypothetical protein
MRLFLGSFGPAGFDQPLESLNVFAVFASRGAIFLSPSCHSVLH